MKIKIILLTIFLGNLIFFITPQTSTSAQTTNCPSGDKPIRIENGLLTTIDATTAINKFSTTSLCITNEQASIPQFALPTYPKMKSLYFDQLKANSSLYAKETITVDANQGILQAKLDNNKDTIIYVSGNVDLNGFNQPNKSKVIVAFIDGDLSVSNNLNYGATSSDRGLVLIVGGKVKIDKGVTTINAFIINFGQFCSAWDSGSCPSSVTDSQQLIINGSIISLPKNAADKPKFVRSLVDNGEPAEKIVFQPKYLIILKDIFSRDLTIWKEIQ